MDHDLLIKALEATQKGQSFAFATLIEATGKGTPRKAGAKMIVFNDGTVYGSIGGGRNEMAAQRECLKCIKTGKPSRVTYKYFGKKGQSICGGQIEVFTIELMVITALITPMFYFLVGALIGLIIGKYKNQKKVRSK